MTRTRAKGLAWTCGHPTEPGWYLRRASVYDDADAVQVVRDGSAIVRRDGRPLGRRAWWYGPLDDHAAGAVGALLVAHAAQAPEPVLKALANYAGVGLTVLPMPVGVLS